MGNLSFGHFLSDSSCAVRRHPCHLLDHPGQHQSTLGLADSGCVMGPGAWVEVHTSGDPPFHLGAPLILPQNGESSLGAAAERTSSAEEDGAANFQSFGLIQLWFEAD